jgi:chemotaxis protein CheC
MCSTSMSATPFRRSSISAWAPAGAALSAALESLVGLSVPKIDLVRLDRFSDISRASWAGRIRTRARFGRRSTTGSMARCSCSSVAKGRARLSEKLGYTDEGTDGSEQELLLDFTNVFVGACMNGIARQLAIQLRYSAPSILSLNAPLSTMLEQLEVSVDSLLLVNVDFALQDCSFRSQLVILFPNASMLR